PSLGNRHELPNPASLRCGSFREAPQSCIRDVMRKMQNISEDGGGASTEAIVERITTAMLEQRLPLGAKLGEEKLCAAFGVSRTKVRQALNRLARSKLVVLKPRRGAFLAEPTPEEARQIFEARRVVESEIF